MSQTMLLTKPLSTFLAANTSPQLHTLLLLSPTGKLLSSSSPSPASTLRTQATLACSLWSLYQPFPTTASPLLSASLSSSSIANQRRSDQDLNNITVQLELGVMCIRALRSGLLFVAIGPSSSLPSATVSPQPSSQYLQQNLTSHASPPASPNTQLEREQASQLSLHVEVASGAGSDSGSVGTERSAGASIWGIRRQAEEVSRFLEGALQGFVLSAVER